MTLYIIIFWLIFGFGTAIGIARHSGNSYHIGSFALCILLGPIVLVIVGAAFTFAWLENQEHTWYGKRRNLWQPLHHKDQYNEEQEF